MNNRCEASLVNQDEERVRQCLVEGSVTGCPWWLENLRAQNESLRTENERLRSELLAVRRHLESVRAISMARATE